MVGVNAYQNLANQLQGEAGFGITADEANAVNDFGSLQRLLDAHDLKITFHGGDFVVKNKNQKLLKENHN
jgi:hypothetical protein